jgi:GTP pyrophosphokinase/guanosine-3',5'-bis(diphosphate) 3'-pyrophosphohydrolase
LRQFELVERVRAYDPHVDEALINRAYVYAVKKHGAQLRASGDPYFAHPIEVAGILADLKLDTGAIVTALLHDTIEDTNATREEIAEMFGEDVAGLVEGVTKLTRLELTSERSKQAENLRKFILAVSKDVRVLLVKLADRLHNMRTLDFLQSEDKRQRIAKETLDIYAPLARSIGIEKIASELEDLSFKHMNPTAHLTILKRLEDMRLAQGDAIGFFAQEIMRLLQDNAMHARIYGREKKPYSIWQKLQRKSISFNQIADIFAFRVIVDTPQDCYTTLGILHRAWPCVPDRFRDWISTPKSNNYRSLQTTVIGPGGMRIELQIRTEEMERYNESGVAAHWRYKDENYGYDSASAEAAGGDPLLSIRKLLQILEHGGDADDFLEHARMEMFQDQVFAFTPKGDLVTLPKGGTSLDFAYAVHTRIGDHCLGAKINGTLKPLRTPIENGDVVEVILGDQPEIPSDWRSLVVSGRAKSAIKRRLKQTERDEFLQLGRAAAAQAVQRAGHKLKDISLKDALTRLDQPSEEALFEAMGKGRISARELVEALFPGLKEAGRTSGMRSRIESGQGGALYVRGGGVTPGVSVSFAPCCTPLPGDRIVGIIQPDKGVAVHAIDCQTLAKFEDQQDQWLDLRWTPEAERNSTSVGRILTTMHNAPGALGQVSAIVGENKGNIVNLRLNQRATDFFVVEFDIEVVDAKHLTHIAAALRACPAVETVERPRGESELI